MANSARTYQRQIRKLKELLREVTWVQPTYNGSPSCSGCGNQQHFGHEADCPIIEVIDGPHRIRSTAMAVTDRGTDG